MSKRFWKLFAYGLLGLLVLFNILAYSLLKAYIADRGEGNIRLSLKGVYVQSLTYEKAERRVLLIGMMHIADDTFFQTVIASIPKTDSLVLLEGVADAQHVAGAALDYSRLARWLGTSYQDKAFDQELKKEHDYLYADVSAADLSPGSRHFLELLAKEDDWRKKLRTTLDDSFDQEEWDRAEKSFQAERNQKLLAHFDEVSSLYKVIAIPWGATHIDDFAREMEARGYRLARRQENRAISFGW